MLKRVAILCVLVLVVAGVILQRQAWRSAVRLAPGPTPFSVALIEHPRTPADRIVNGAKQEVIRRVQYDSSYVRIPYPNGDFPSDRGACTDVVIRALRNAGYDLQALVHEDMKRNFSLYPRRWGLSRTDSSIDHRRVPNLMVFFKRFGTELPKQTDRRAAENWKPGDIVCWDLGSHGLTHTGIISNDRGDRGLPLVIHNIGPVATQEDRLDNWTVIGHFRYPK